MEFRYLWINKLLVTLLLTLAIHGAAGAHVAASKGSQIPMEGLSPIVTIDPGTTSTFSAGGGGFLVAAE